MAEAQYSPNHTIDPETGYLESKSYPYAFDAPKKKAFIKCLVDSGLGIYDACDAMGLSHHTFFKHYHNDPEFKKDFDKARLEYGSRLDAISKRNAMNPKSVIERIFQLKSIYPEQYADQRTGNGSINITLNIDSQSLSRVRQRDEVIEASIASAPALATGSSTLSASNERAEK